MSCCGCASRVLKLQSELRSWKTRLANEKREKKMILKWIMAVFGYDVRVDIDKESRGIRLQATENKDGVQKALIKLGLGGTNEGDLGMMVMELKLEDNEFFEPFEEPHDIPEFPILEINSMSSQQAPVVNTGISTLGPISHHHSAPTMSITTPMEVTSTPLPLPISSGVDQEVVYIAGNLEDGATLEGLNGQYIIVRANEAEELPVQLDYSLNDDGLVGMDPSSVYFRPNTLSNPVASTNLVAVNEIPNAAISYLPVSAPTAPLQLNLPTVVTPAPAPAPVPYAGHSLVPVTVIEELQSSVFRSSISSSPVSISSASGNKQAKKKSSLSSTKSHTETGGINKPSSKKQKTGGETNIKIKNVVSRAHFASGTTSAKTQSPKTKNNPSSSSPQEPKPVLVIPLSGTNPPPNPPILTSPVANRNDAFEFGLTL